MIFLHLLIPILLSSYSFLTKKNLFDYIYILCVFLVCFHWTFLNGECIITYLKKKKEDPHYIAGKDAMNTDFLNHFKGYSIIIHLITFIVNMLISINMYIAITRNHYPKEIAISFIILYQGYYYGNHFFSQHHINQNFQLFQSIIHRLLILWLVVFIGFHTLSNISTGLRNTLNVSMK